VGSWFGYKSGHKDGLAKGKKVGTDAGKVEGIKGYLRKELIESKQMDGKYPDLDDVIKKAREALEKDMRSTPAKKDKGTDWLAWTVLIVGGVMLWLIWQS
jgi:hypothetical protein